MIAVLRQVVAAVAVAVGLFQVRPWLAGIDHTSLDGALRLAAVLAPAGVLYIAAVTLLGGRELATLMATFKRGGGE